MVVEQQAQPATGEDAEGRRSTAYEPDPRRWRILAVSLVVGFMSLLDVTIVNVAIPSMQSGLDTSAAAVQWVVSGYALSFGLVLVIGAARSSGSPRASSSWWPRGCSRASAPGC